MPKRRLPTRPDVEFLKREAKELLTDYRRETQDAVADFGAYHPTGVRPRDASLTDAQVVVARSYRFVGWSRLRLAAELCRAVYESDAETVHSLAEKHPELLCEPVRGSDTGASWGTPVACARYFGRQDIVDLLIELSGNDAEDVMKQASAWTSVWPIGSGRGDALDTGRYCSCPTRTSYSSPQRTANLC